MAYTIVLDPGHGGSDPGAVFQGRQEKDDSLRLAMAVGDILRENGYNVEFTRTTDVYNTPFEKATFANNLGADLFVSIHRNSAPTENMYNGVQTLLYNDSGLKAELARNINKNLVNLGFADKGVVERPNLVVLKRTKMPAVLVEAGFINSEKDNSIFDDEFDQVAQAIAIGIMETLKQSGNSGMENDNSDPVYRVQVGAFRNQILANNLAYQLVTQGYPARVVYENGLYKVKVGRFSNLDNAAMMEQRLRENGYNTFITK